MPWCPVCKNEYKDGYTLCADCGAELVDFLSEETIDENNSADDIVLDGFDQKDDDLTQIYDEIEETRLDLEEFKNLKKAEPLKPFVKASERAENYKSSAFALLFVGIIGIIFLVLSYLKVIPINLAANINALFYVVMGFMFIAFIFIGIKTMSSAKAIAQTADDEDKLTEDIYTYFKMSCSATSIDEIAFTEDSALLSEEEKFFPRSNTIKRIIIDKFGQLDEAYLTELTESVYSSIFE